MAAQNLNLSLISGFLRGLKPDPIITVTEWANRNRILPPGSARPGPYSSKVTPYLEEIMDCLSAHNPIQEIIFKKGSQIGATEIGLNWIGYIMDISPDPIIIVMPSQDIMQKTSKLRIQPMIDACPSLVEKTATSKARDSSNTILFKQFENGSLIMVGANSPTALSSVAAKNLMFDEAARFPEDVGGEGSVIELGKTRQSTYGDRAKTFTLSTPTLKGTCLISAEYEETDQREYHVPCPHCNGLQVLNFFRLKYTPPLCDDARYECMHCRLGIEERHKTWMMDQANGARYIAKHPEKASPIKAGFHVSAMYSPYGMYSWAKMARDFEGAKTVEKEKVFTNTKLGLEFEVKGEKPDWESIKNRGEDYTFATGQVKNDVVILTCGVDVQADRLELEVVGWSKGMQSQQVLYDVLKGDTKEKPVWDMLQQVIERKFKRTDGVPLYIAQTALDSNYNTPSCYAFSKKMGTKVAAIQGRDTVHTYFTPPKSQSINKDGKVVGYAKVWGVGASFLKEEVYSMLAAKIDEKTGEVPNRYCSFPANHPFGDDYFKGLTAEEQVLEKNKKTGHLKRIWVKKFKRNEALDVRCYAVVAAAMLKLQDRKASWWTDMQAGFEPEPPEEIRPETTPLPKVKAKKPSIWK